ncbi:MAG: cytochrome c biogenesis CcdA family protein [Patescibacteria group bacterium]
MLKLLNKLIVFVGIGFLLATPAFVSAQQSFSSAEVYYNEACGGCNVYLQEKLIPYLEEQGLVVEMHDYVNDKQARKDMNAFQERLGIPYELQSHIMTFVDNGKLVIGGHVPLERVEELFAAGALPDQLVVYQDQMLEMGINPDTVSYTIWQPDVEVKEYELNEPLTTYLSEWEVGSLQPSKWQEKSLLPLVLTTGLVDGLNPCAFAVLLFFIAFLYSIRRSTRQVWLMGATYIAGIYLIYLSIGLGLFQAVTISSQPHFIAKVAAWLIIGLGGLTVTQHLFPQLPFRFRLPSFSKVTIKEWLTKATLPASFIAGVIVGLCTFPCSGGIYVAVVSMLTTQSTFAKGLGYLAVYNVMFVVPLIAILLAVGNKKSVEKVETWEKKKAGMFKLISGVVMVLLGLSILIWFV